MKPVLLCGSLAYDRIMDFEGNFSEHFLPDKLHAINLSFFVSPPKEEFGGTGGNIAYGLSLLGVSTSVVATVGTDFLRYEAHLKEHGVDMIGVARRDDLPTASGYIMTDKADNQIAAFSGSAAMEANAGTLSYDTYALAVVSPTNKDDMVRIAREAKAAGLPLFFDPGQQIPVFSGDELKTALQGAAGALVNDYELALITEKTGWDEMAIVAHAGFLIVTLGAEGSRILTSKGEERVTAVPVEEVVDPTGAGDAFRAGFIAGYVRALPLLTCTKLGSTVAAYAVECYGTQNYRFTHPELGARYTGTYKEPFPF
ncbi:MAG: carbohydrate kinase family protein [Minisyncoccia bacterium]